MKIPTLPKHIAVRDIAMFQGLLPLELSRLQSQLFPVVLGANSPLLTAGESGGWVYFIVQGTVRIFRPQTRGTCIIFNMVGAGDMLGEIAALDNRGHSASAWATENTALLKMRRHDFCVLEETLPQVSRNLKHLLAARLRFATTHNAALAERKVHLRVARLLLAMADRYATTPGQETVAIPLRLTQKEIAEWARVSRQHADKHLAQLDECGVLSRETSHRILIRDRTELARHCD